MAEVIMKDPSAMNLLGLILKHLLERNLEDAGKAAAARRMNCVVGVKGGKMGVTIIFRKGEIILERGFPTRANSRITGTLDALLQVAVTRNYIAPFLAGRLKIGGNPFPLLRLMSLLVA